MAKYFEENPKGLPDHDAAIGCQVLLLQLFSVGIWRKLLTFLDADGDGEVSTEELKALDIDGKYLLNTIQDFVFKLGMKPQIHLVANIISTLYLVIIRPTKIIKGILKDHEIKVFCHFLALKNFLFKKIFFKKNIRLGNQPLFQMKILENFDS